MKDYRPQTYEVGLAPWVDEFVADQEAIRRRYRLSYTSGRLDRLERLYREWQSRVLEFPFGELSHTAKIDRALLLNYFERARCGLARTRQESTRLAEAIPYSGIVADLEEGRAAMADVDPQTAAAQLSELAGALEKAEPSVGDAPAMEWTKELRDAIERWAEFHDGFDPVLSWWVREPLARAREGFRSLVERAEALDKELKEIPGRPVGRSAIEEDLRFEMVPYSPEELIAIGEREYAWCLEEMLRASRELGFGDDWRAALEHVKGTCLPPGGQPAMVRGLALEAIEYVRDLVSIPPLAEEVWAMEMMSPERQKVNPFFLGGETIIVSYPTDAMTHEEKQMSMRGNNPNFSRATVQHELIPGHHLQLYSIERFRRYRRLFDTPFWIEGWTLYWELLLWELGFPRTPEERIGMLFWRMHRCVRVSFSLRFHLGELTTAECVDILVDRVGHERANAEGEVRRSFNGMYPPLYQAAYMIGGLQFQAISRELRERGWTLREVHDAMMRENEMPPALMRLALLGEDPPADGAPVWKFDAD